MIEMHTGVVITEVEPIVENIHVYSHRKALSLSQHERHNYMGNNMDAPYIYCKDGIYGS